MPLARDVIFLAEADEEGGLATARRGSPPNHWAKIDCEFALNEGGWIMKGRDGRVQVRQHLDGRQGVGADRAHGDGHVDAFVDAAARQRDLRAVPRAGEAGRLRDQS